MNGLPEIKRISQDIVMETLRSVLLERGEITLPATGFSMGPMFQSAESLVIRSCSHSPALSPGAILVFERNEGWVAHRLWMKWGDVYLTGGDAVWTLDWPPLRRDGITGRVVALWRNGRRVELESGMAWWRRPRWITGGILRLLRKALGWGN